MSLEEFDSAAHALGLASEFRDMLTGALLEAHEWLWVPEFPVSLLADERNWRSFCDEEFFSHSDTWGQDFLDTVAAGGLSHLPVVIAAVAGEPEGAPAPNDEPCAWLNVWDGNHRLAALLGTDVDPAGYTLPAAVGWPAEVPRSSLKLGMRALPEIQAARLTSAQALARQLLDATKALPFDRAFEMGMQECLAVGEALAFVNVPHKVWMLEGQGAGVARRRAAVEVDGLLLSVSATGNCDDVFFQPGRDDPLATRVEGLEVHEVDTPTEPTMGKLKRRREQLENLLRPMAIQWSLKHRLAQASSPRIASRF